MSCSPNHERYSTQKSLDDHLYPARFISRSKGQIDNYAAAAWNFIIENICLWCWFWWGSLGLGSYGFGLRRWLLMVSLKVICGQWCLLGVLLWWLSLIFGRWLFEGAQRPWGKGVFMGGPHWRFALVRVVVLLQCKVLGIWHRCKKFYEFIFYWKKVVIEKV